MSRAQWFSSVQSLSHVRLFVTPWTAVRSVMSDSLWPHGLQYAKLPCPSPTPGAYSNSRPLSRWCHPTISSSVVPFSSCPQSFPASGSFEGRQFFASGGQSTGASASASVPSSECSGLISFRMDWFDLLAVQGTLKNLLQLYSSKNWCFWVVVLEKTLQSPLDSEEIKPVHPKRNQPWILIGRTDAEAEASIVWPPDAKNELLRKDPDAGKNWRCEKGTT